MAEQRTLNPQVPGSNPGGRTDWPIPHRPSQRYKSLVVSYLEVVHAQAMWESFGGRSVSASRRPSALGVRQRIGRPGRRAGFTRGSPSPVPVVAPHHLVELAVDGAKPQERSDHHLVTPTAPQDDEVRGDAAPIGVQPADHLVPRPRARVEEVGVGLVLEVAHDLGVQDQPGRESGEVLVVAPFELEETVTPPDPGDHGDRLVAVAEGGEMQPSCGCEAFAHLSEELGLPRHGHHGHPGVGLVPGRLESDVVVDGLGVVAAIDDLDRPSQHLSQIALFAAKVAKRPGAVRTGIPGGFIAPQQAALERLEHEEGKVHRRGRVPEDLGHHTVGEFLQRQHTRLAGPALLHQCLEESLGRLDPPFGVDERRALVDHATHLGGHDGIPQFRAIATRGGSGVPHRSGPHPRPRRAGSRHRKTDGGRRE